MHDDQKWALAFAQLRGFAGNLPNSPAENDVTRYHSILDSLQQASGIDLTAFRIDPARVNPRITGAQRAAYGRPGSGRTFYSREKYCEPQHFMAQIDSLMLFLNETMQPKAPIQTRDNEAAYRAMPKWKLEEMAVLRGIKPKRIVDANGERWVPNQEHFIRELLRSDRQESGYADGAPAPTYNLHIENMTNSAVMHGSHGSTITQNTNVLGPEFKDFLAELKAKLPSLPLPAENIAAAQADITAVEAQLQSPRPRTSLIHECMNSVRSILEIAAGDLAAMGLIAGIARFFH
jgi:hypothetical protein